MELKKLIRVWSLIAESATVRRRQNNSREWEVLSSPSLDSGQFEVTFNAPGCNSTTNSNFRPADSNANPAASSTLSDPGGGGSNSGGNFDASDTANCIRMSDLVLVQRCSTLPRNYRKIISQRSDDNTKSPATYSLSPPFPMALPANMEIHQVKPHPSRPFFLLFWFKIFCR